MTLTTLKCDIVPLLSLKPRILARLSRSHHPLVRIQFAVSFQYAGVPTLGASGPCHTITRIDVFHPTLETPPIQGRNRVVIGIYAIYCNSFNSVMI